MLEGMRRPRSEVKHTTRWRTDKARDHLAREAHNAATREWWRKIRMAEWPEWRREKLLQLIREGYRVSEAAYELGTTYQDVYGIARIDDSFQQELDEALRDAAPPGVKHGTPWGYKQGCACPSCKQAHHGR